VANWFVEGGWRFKALHRLILLSNTYRQASTSPVMETAMEKDPNNKLLWQFSRRRLEAEEIRDAALAIAGKLNTKAAGPGVIVPADPELVNLLYKPSQWAVAPDPDEHRRRSVYLLPMTCVSLYGSFRRSDMQITCLRREAIHAPQALELLGDLPPSGGLARMPGQLIDPVAS
jgi:hypothetical protein